MRGLIIIIATVFGLVACTEQATGPMAFQGVGVQAQSGTRILRDSVNGLTVGDRLMDAGEYELALRAYLRSAAENGSSAELITALGSANLKLGRLGQAERLLRQAVAEEPDFVPAWNNLGVVLMEQGEYGEARLVFQQAFALDSGQTDSIRENLRLAIARMEDVGYIYSNNEGRFDLVRQGEGHYVLLETP